MFFLLANGTFQAQKMKQKKSKTKKTKPQKTKFLMFWEKYLCSKYSSKRKFL